MEVKQTDREIANAWISHMLAQLYERWPRRLDFNAVDLGAKTQTPPSFEDEELFDDMIDWLVHEGISGPEMSIRKAMP